MSIDRLRAHWGFTRMPFSKTLAPSMLAATSAHHEAVARIAWCVTEEALGVITGEVGAGKTVAARAALANLDTSRHRIIYLGNPAVGARGLYAAIISALGGTPRFHKAALIPKPNTPSPSNTTNEARTSSSWSMKPTSSALTNSKSSACCSTPTWTADRRSRAS